MMTTTLRGASVRPWAIAALCLAAAASTPAQSPRREILLACAQQAKDKALEGDAHAAFMRDCLRPPPGYQPPVFSTSEPIKDAPHPATGTGSGAGTGAAQPPARR